MLSLPAPLLIRLSRCPASFLVCAPLPPAPLLICLAGRLAGELVRDPLVTVLGADILPVAPFCLLSGSDCYFGANLAALVSIWICNLASRRGHIWRRCARSQN